MASPKKTRKRGLGRGLDALLQADPKAVQTLPVGRLEPNRHQPRTRFDETALDELAESIKSQGVVQPIVVTPTEGDRYQIIAGERRWRAAQRAGLEEVPVAVREVSGERELLELALVENLQRSDLDPVEEAEAYRSLQDTFELSQQAIAQRVGKARSTVANSLRLLHLPRAVLDLLTAGRLTAGQARPLLALDDVEQQVALATRAAEEGLTARDLEELARTSSLEAAEESSGGGTAKGGTAKTKTPAEEPNTRAAAETLTRRLQAKVEIRRRGKGGMVRIHFHSEDELMRLYDLLMERPIDRGETR